MRTIETGRAIGAALAALALCLAALAAACTSDDDPPDVTVEAPAAASPAGGSGADSGSSSADSSDSDDAGDSGADDSGGSSGDADDDASDTVSNVNQNPSGAGPDLDTSMNDALVGAAPLDLATWTVEPTLSPGELVAEGTLEAGAVLFFPAFGEGYAFAVHYIGQEEPLVVLLPDLGPLEQWRTDLTVAPTEHEIEGPSFRLRAYSPLFMDVGDPTGLELRLYGFDASGEPALLAAREIVAR